MSGFYDTVCPKCKKRFGWQGEITDQPPCPKCKHKPNLQAIENDSKEVGIFKQYLL